MEKILYTKFSNDRADCFKIKTCIEEGQNGELRVYKEAVNDLSKKHIENLVSIYDNLNKQYEGTNLSVNKCYLENGRAYFEYLEGKKLEEILDELIAKSDIEGFKAVLLQYVDIIRSTAKDDFEITDAYKEIFGTLAPKHKQKCSKISDVDLIFENIFVNGETWTITDYEWTFNFPIPVDFILYRTIFYFIHCNHTVTLPDDIDLYSLAGIDEQDKKIYKKMDDAFQKYVVGNTVLLGEIHSKIRGEIFFPLGMVQQQKIDSLNRKITVLQHISNLEDDLIYSFSPNPDADGHIRFEIKPEKEIERLHINLANCKCIVEFNKISAVGTTEKELNFITNGISVVDNYVVFENDNPSVLVELPKELPEKIEVDLVIHYAADEIGDAFINMKNTADDMRNLTNNLKSEIEMLKNDKAQLEAEKDNLNNTINTITNSISWKITKPIRALFAKRKDK